MLIIYLSWYILTVPHESTYQIIENTYIFSFYSLNYIVSVSHYNIFLVVLLNVFATQT